MHTYILTYTRTYMKLTRRRKGQKPLSTNEMVNIRKNNLKKLIANKLLFLQKKQHFKATYFYITHTHF